MKKYLLFFFVSSFIIFAVLIIFNYLIDPIWANGGNKYSQKNFTFNERLSKSYLLKTYPNTTSCFIFGSSKSTLLNPKLINNGNCFNFSFSGGRINEYINFAEYIKGKGFNPKYIIIECSRFNFTDKLQENVPKYISETNSFPFEIVQYLSIDVFNWSIRTVSNESPMPRYYNKDFICVVGDWAPKYNPNIEKLLCRPIKLRRLQDFNKIKKIFPNAKFIGLIPPLSPWNVYKIYYGNEEKFFELTKRLLEIFDEFYDFSIPSHVTYNLNNSYDGIHFYPIVMNQVAKEIDPTNSNKSIYLVSCNNYEDYVLNFLSKIRQFEIIAKMKNDSKFNFHFAKLITAKSKKWPNFSMSTGKKSLAPAIR